MLEVLKKNWLIVVLVSVLIVLVSEKIPSGVRPVMMTAGESVPAMGMASNKMIAPAYDQYQPAPDGAARMVAQDSSLSLKVADVNESIAEVESIARKLGGYLVNSNVSTPEEGASGSITIRVPSEKLKAVLEDLRGMAVKVVSESVNGTDVTDQYYDAEARLATLVKTKGRFEQILEQATTTQQLLEAQREISNLEYQIDAIKGQQKYLEQTTKTALVSVYLATDEFSLPYVPNVGWRPEVVFKEAIRSLVINLREVGNGLIWLAVYGVVWLPALLLVWFFVKRKK